MNTTLLVTSDLTCTTNSRDEIIKSYGLAEQFASNDKLFQNLLSTVANIFRADSAHISLIGEDVLSFLSFDSKSLRTIPVSESFCRFTIKSVKPTIFSNPDKFPEVHSIFKDVKFYAGIPLINKDNFNIGALSITHSKKLKLKKHHIKLLELLSNHIVHTLDEQKGLVDMIKGINKNFRPAACADINCLQGELAHLQSEVVEQKRNLEDRTEELKKSNRKFESFAHTVAHDIKAPLRSIMSFNQIIKGKLDSNNLANTEKYFEIINRSGKNLEDLITNLLNLSEVNTKEVEMEKVSLSEVLEEVLLNLDSTIKASKAKIITPTFDYQIKGNKVQLCQLFQNFLGNGLKYQAEGNVPEVQVSVNPLGERVLISVQDNGIGIEKQYLNTIFEPFQRLHNDKQYGGSGVGLSICLSILESHNGIITVDSEVGKGSSFTFTLPRYIEESVEETDQSSPT